MYKQNVETNKKQVKNLEREKERKREEGGTFNCCQAAPNIGIS